MEDSDADFSSYDDEFVGDLKIAGNNVVWDRPAMRIRVQSDVEPCLFDSALLTVLMTKLDIEANIRMLLYKSSFLYNKYTF